MRMRALIFDGFQAALQIDASAGILSDMLSYIYSGSTAFEQRNMDFVLELLTVSNRFLLQGLQHACEFYFIENFNKFKESVLVIWEVASQTTSCRLQAVCEEMMFRNWPDIKAHLSSVDLQSKHHLDLLSHAKKWGFDLDLNPQE